MSLFSGLGSSISSFLSSILGAATRFFGSLFQSEVNIVDNLHHIVEKFDEIKASIERESQLLRHFQFEPHWKSRVINVPVAIDQMKDLVAVVVDAFKGKFEVLKAPIHDLALIFKSEAEPSADQEKPAALSRAAVKVDEIATMIEQLAKAMDSISDMSHVFETVTQQIESLDAVFLQQGNRQVKQTLTVRRRQ